MKVFKKAFFKNSEIEVEKLDYYPYHRYKKVDGWVLLNEFVEKNPDINIINIETCSCANGDYYQLYYMIN